MRKKIIKSEEEKLQEKNKKRNYNRYYYHLVRKNKLIVDGYSKNIINNGVVVKIEVGKFIIET